MCPKNIIKLFSVPNREINIPLSYFNYIFKLMDSNISFCIFDSSRKMIYLIEKNGETAKGFPLRGASMFSIGKLSDKSGWHLIVGGTDRFLYNYRLETE